MHTVLVTGASGCVGSAVAIRLNDLGVRVRILVRPGSDTRFLEGIPMVVHFGDICDAGVLRKAMDGCDAVFHTAAVVTFARKAREGTTPRQRPRDTRGCQGLHRRGGAHARPHELGYGNRHPAPREPADETLPADRSHAGGYKISKILAEDEILDGVGSGLHAVIVNPSVIIGERDTRFHAGQLIRDIKKGRIPFYVEGGMNIVYAGDVAEGMIAAAGRGRAGERYILAGENLTHEEVFRRTAALIGGRPPSPGSPSPFFQDWGDSWSRSQGFSDWSLPDTGPCRHCRAL